MSSRHRPPKNSGKPGNSQKNGLAEFLMWSRSGPSPAANVGDIGIVASWPGPEARLWNSQPPSPPGPSPKDRATRQPIFFFSDVRPMSLSLRMNAGHTARNDPLLSASPELRTSRLFFSSPDASTHEKCPKGRPHLPALLRFSSRQSIPIGCSGRCLHAHRFT